METTTGINFGLAIEAMKKGSKVARKGWNGKGMWCIYVPGSKVELRVNTPYYNALSNNGNEAVSSDPIEILPHFDMWTINAEGRRAFLPGWLASQSDMDADDWEVIT